jgi:hypothetical protein
LRKLVPIKNAWNRPTDGQRDGSDFPRTVNYGAVEQLGVVVLGHERRGDEDDPLDRADRREQPVLPHGEYRQHGLAKRKAHEVEKVAVAAGVVAREVTARVHLDDEDVGEVPGRAEEPRLPQPVASPGDVHDDEDWYWHGEELRTSAAASN